jgi:flagellar FliJ protein
VKTRTPLDLVADLALARSDAAAAALGRALGESRTSAERLALLERYRAEYVTRLTAARARGTTAPELDNFHAFLARLDAAISQQAVDVESQVARVATERGRWMEETRRLEGFRALLERRAAERARGDARREQHLTDEAAARTMLRREEC